MACQTQIPPPLSSQKQHPLPLSCLQLVLYGWKRYHEKSYQAATLVGLLFFPFAISVYFVYLRQLFIWTVFCAITGWLLYKARGGNGWVGIGGIDEPGVGRRGGGRGAGGGLEVVVPSCDLQSLVLILLCWRCFG